MAAPPPGGADGGELLLLRAALEGGPDAVVVVSADGTILTYNAGFQEIWRIPPEVVASSSDDAALASVLDKLLDPEAFLSRVHELYERATGTARDDLLLRDGRVLDRWGTALADGAGTYIGWAWYFRDVTDERRQAQDAVRMAALVAVAQALGEAQSEFDVLSVVSGRGVTAMRANGALLSLLMPGERKVRTLATAFFDEGVTAEVAELPTDFPLPLVHTAATGEPLFLQDRDAAVRLFPSAGELYERARTQGSAAVPLKSPRGTFGALAVAFDQPHPWRQADRALLEALAALTSQALNRIYAQAAEQRAMAQIRGLSETLQRSLLTAPPMAERLHIAVRYQPAAREAQVGGDWYDAFSTSEGTMTLVVGDVAGHDRNAAATMAQVRNVLRGISQALHASPGAVLSALDRALGRLHVDTIASAVLCQTWPSVTPGALVLRWSNAGHPPPLLLHPDGTAELLNRSPELVLGLQSDAVRADHEITLLPGAMLVLYTDGLVERRDRDLDQGLERLRTTAAALHELTPEQLCDALLQRLVGESDDDVAMLVVKITGDPDGS